MLRVIRIVTSSQLFLWSKGGVGRSSTPLAHVPEPSLVPFYTPVGGRKVFCFVSVEIL